jgi:hypothetical protein
MKIMTTTSYIKIYGPPILKAIRELEKIAVDMPEVCIMDTIMTGVPDYTSAFSDPGYTSDYFNQALGSVELKVERCDTIISKSGEKLGEYDFFFEWFTEPSMEQLNELIEKVDEALTPLGCKYTITTK